MSIPGLGGNTSVQGAIAVIIVTKKMIKLHVFDNYPNKHTPIPQQQTGINQRLCVSSLIKISQRG